MTQWEILGIEPTDDLSVIKKAYSRQLKNHHPEDDPEGYQNLREAYDSITKMVKQQKRAEKEAAFSTADDAEMEVDIPEETITEDEEYVPATSLFPDHIGSLHEPLSDVALLLDQAEVLYGDFEARLNEGRWMDLLDQDVLWNMELQQRVSEEMLLFIWHHCLLPKRIWILLENQFGWQQMLKEGNHSLDEEDAEHFYRFYERRIGYFPALRYDWTIGVDMDHESFFHALESAYDEWFKGDFEASEAYAKTALSLFDRHPDVHKLLGQLHLHQGRVKHALPHLVEVTKLDPDDLDAQLSSARALYEDGAYEESAAVLAYLIELEPENTDFLNLYGKVLFKQKKLVEARRVFKQVKHIDPIGDSEVLVYLANIHRIMRNDPGKFDSTTKDIEAELYLLSPGKKFAVFLWSQFRWGMIFSCIFLFVSWHQLGNLAEEIHMNRVGFTLVTIFSMGSEYRQPTSTIIWTIIWTAILLLSLRKIVKRWNRVRRSLVG
ncbi:tetratricopeptide repeat protein [Rossellomorea marisflavi]|uniref:J domain-containing protein n=1 Tax=Rossellomorea marisflavi TaxID=189381 RepID=UPI002853562C|nr:tetratricopeptide repeat protein [Rossellomorea marisflavi]MDR4935034.1 tetratricopeptide repeat protein [Rossellomorea marisflavi]